MREYDSLLVTAGYDQVIKVWSIADGKQLAVIPHNEGHVNALSITSNGRDLALAAWQRVRIYDVLVSKDPKATIDLPKNVTVVGFEAAGRWMFTGGDDGVCRIWEMRSNQLVANRMLGLNPLQITSIVTNVNQTEMFIATNEGVFVWDMISHHYQRLPMPDVMAILECVEKLAIHPSGKRLTGISNRGRIFIWDLMTRQIADDASTLENFKTPMVPVEKETSTYGVLRDEEKYHKLPKGYGITLRYSPNGKYLVAVGSEPEIYVMNAETMEFISSFNTQTVWNWDAVFSADGRHIFTGGEDFKVKVWDVKSSSLLAVWEGHQKPITALCTNIPSN